MKLSGGSTAAGSPQSPRGSGAGFGGHLLLRPGTCGDSAPPGSRRRLQEEAVNERGAREAPPAPTAVSRGQPPGTAAGAGCAFTSSRDVRKHFLGTRGTRHGEQEGTLCRARSGDEGPARALLGPDTKGQQSRRDSSRRADLAGERGGVSRRLAGHRRAPRPRPRPRRAGREGAALGRARRAGRAGRARVGPQSGWEIKSLARPLPQNKGFPRRPRT